LIESLSNGETVGTIEKITASDILIDLLGQEFKTVKIDHLLKIIPCFVNNTLAQFSNHDIYKILFNGETVSLKKKGYYPKYRYVQNLVWHLRNIELIDCEDVLARGYGVRLYCTLNINHCYWILSEENRRIFVKLHEIRNVVTKGRAWNSSVDKEKAFKRYVAVYFKEKINEQF